jgi:hypothetical protein
MANTVRDRLVKLLRGRRQPVSTRDHDDLREAASKAAPPHTVAEKRR